MNNYFDFKDYIFVSYGVPFISSDAINTLITGYAILGPFKVDAFGIQARLIGSWFLFFSLIIMLYVLVKIPKSFGVGKVKEILNVFFRSPFFITWMMCIFFSIFNELIPLGTFIFLGMLIVCFYFQRKFNKKLIEIYNQ